MGKQMSQLLEKQSQFDWVSEMAEFYGPFLTADGFDDAIVGICHSFGKEPVVCYNQKRVLDNLISQGMTEEEAQEYFDYNIIGAYVGERTPCFLETP